MKRVGFKMKLKPGFAEEYKKRHDHIWPELKRLLKESGIEKYSIWLDKETDTLFAVQTLLDSVNDIKLSEHPIMKKWWAYMADLMGINEYMSPVCKNMKEVFFMV